METLEILYLLIALTLGTQICRFLPWIMPKTWLTHPILQKMNKMLPLAIMVLLLATSINIPNVESQHQDHSLFIAQSVSLVIVVFSYKWLQNMLLSVGLGIINLNLWLWAFNS